MSSIQLKNVIKRYGQVEVVHGVDLDIEEGEFVVLLGPSGCGKTTTLRMVAGLEDVSDGELSIGGAVVNDVAPKNRGVAMVFQNYALYPHMTVRKNMEFALRPMKLDASEVERRIADTAEILGLGDLLERRPSQLSGGQRQRVAMGRAMVRTPDVFLFDEPLSNLDAKLRVEMRTEIKELHQRLGASMVYVTHDQIEAMTLATKIVVMKGGIIQQIGSPAEIYNRPANLFVADFMGNPAMNLIPAKAQSNGAGTRIEIERRDAAPIVLTDEKNRDLPQDVIIGVRPEDIAEPGARAAQVVQETECMVDIVEPAGADTYVVMQMGGKQVTARLHAETSAEPGKMQPLAIDLGKVSYFEPNSGQRLN